MPGDEIVNLDLDPRQQRQQFWHRVVRVGLPVGAVLLIVASIIGIALFGYVSNRRDALALSRDVLTALDKRVGGQLTGYLMPAVRVLNLFHSTLPRGVFAAGQPELARNLAIGVLRSLPQIALVSFADANGDFLMVNRADDDGGVAIKTIDNREGARRVGWERRDAQGQVLSRTEDPADTYDPRTRPWFTGALHDDGRVSWTDLYIFFTDRAPGITASLALSAPAGRPAEVAGVDISLKALSAFLAGLEIGKTGRAMIIDHDGRLVAFPDPARVMTTVDGQPVPASIDQLGDPVLTRAYDRLRVLGYGWHVMDDEGTRFIIASSSLREIVGRDWSLLFVVPEDDFVGFVAANNRTSLLMSVGVVALAVGLAALLARQGWRADRTARALRQREETLQAQRQAFADLAATADLFDPEARSGAGRLTETVAHTLQARRVSLWRLDPGRGVLLCEDCYDRETRGHTAGGELPASDCPGLIEALQGEAEIVTADAASDPRTGDLYRLYLHPAGCRALLAMPVRSHGRVHGTLWVEDRGGGAMGETDAMGFVRSVAGMLAPRYAAAAPAVPAPAGPPAAAGLGEEPAVDADIVVTREKVAPSAAMRTVSIGGARTERFRTRLAAKGLDDEALADAAFPEVAVMVMRFVDPLAAAAPAAIPAAAPGAAEAATDRSPLLNQVVLALQRIAETHEIDYLKILSDQVVAAEGFSGDAAQQARAIAELALEIQAFCGEAFAGTERPVHLAIGLDQGTVFGSSVGFGRVAFNIWGDPVRVAQAMATTAPPGDIQITDRIYRHLASRYMARSRGAFYVKGEGELSTYLLKGRL
ncbi:MAG: adenylate/guanylate cyclase domain-containing protein [Rhodospirillales bacterium]